MNMSMNGSQETECVSDPIKSESEERKAWEPPVMVRLDVSAAGTTPSGHGTDSIFNYS